MRRLKWKLGSICLEIVLIMMQDRCMVCMERTICSEFNLDAPYSKKTFWTQSMVLLGEEAQIKAPFSLFGDNANLDVR